MTGVILGFVILFGVPFLTLWVLTKIISRLLSWKNRRSKTIEERILEQIVICYPVTPEEVKKCYGYTKSIDATLEITKEVLKTNRSVDYLLHKYIKTQITK